MFMNVNNTKNYMNIVNMNMYIINMERVADTDIEKINYIACRNAGPSGIRSVLFGMKKKTTTKEPFQYRKCGFFSLSLAEVIDARMPMPGIGFLVTDAQLCRLPLITFPVCNSARIKYKLVESLQSHMILTMSHWSSGLTCLLPATRVTGSNPQGGTYVKPGFSC
jgi:hypothetical protein